MSTLSNNDDQPLNQTPDPQVIPGNTEYGNRYPRAYKLKILQEADACTKPGEIGQLLRRAGLTHATLTCFRRQRASGSLDAPSSQSKSKTASGIDPQTTQRVLDLERENRRLKRQLEQAEAIIDVQKKVARLLEISLDRPEH